MTPPIFLLAFANEHQDAAAYLRNLPREVNTLRDVLERAEEAGLCQLDIYTNVRAEQLFGAFQKPANRGRVAILHYGGHAGSFELLFESVAGETQAAQGEGLIPFLAGQAGLQLVFLNGCYTARMARALIQAGVPSVIGTVQAVDDRLATELAAAFYQGMARGLSIGQAWKEATYQQVARLGHNQEGYYRGLRKEAGGDRFPWEIHYREGAGEVAGWNLPDAAAAPLFGLPPAPDRYLPPNTPFRFLDRYDREDAAIFFGRGHYIRDLYQRLTTGQSAPVILLYGQSGAGKSSLLQAGLLPRLEAAWRVLYLRRDPQQGLADGLCQALDAGDASPETLRNRWAVAAREQPLLVVMDQVEEVFTRPRPDDAAELTRFLSLIQALFDAPERYRQSRLILSYRKEYDPEIDQALHQHRIPFEKVFLDKLDKRGILEIVNGLTSTQQLRNKYNLRLEEGLDVEIADDLLADRDSPIAPVLQIILTKLWEQVRDESERWFRTDAYRRLRQQGILLHDFFEQQLAAIRDWEEEVRQAVERSGLALDILHHHTTALGTAESRSLDELRRLYEHRSDILDDLIGKFKDLYLLTGIDAARTGLAHDTLAPIVQREMRDSDRPGQRGRRILENKRIDYERQPDSTFLEEDDLFLVEEGAAGMRIWMPKERELIEKSRQRRARLEAERRRNRWFRRFAVGAIAILAVFATILWRISEKNRKKALADATYNRGLLLSSSDPTAGLDLMLRASRMDPADGGKLDGAYDVYSRNLLYEIVRKEDAGFLNRAVFAPDGSVFAAAVDADDVVRVYDAASGALRRELRGPRSPVYALTLQDSNYIFAGSEDRRAYRWQLAGGAPLVFAAPPGADSSSVRVLALSDDGRRLATGHVAPFMRIWDAGSGELLQELALAGTPTGLAFAPDGQSLWASIAGERIYRIFLDGRPPLSLPGWGASPLCVAVSSRGDLLAAGYSDRKLLLWDITPAGPVFRDSLQAHDDAVVDLHFSADGRYLLTASRDHTARVWEMPGGRLWYTLRGHADWLQSVGMTSNMTAIFTAARDSTVRQWSFPDPLPQWELSGGDYQIAGLAYSPDGRYLLGAGRDRKVYVWEAATGYHLEGHYDGHGSSVQVVAVTPDGTVAASGDRRGNVHIWNLTTRQPVVTLQLHDGPVNGLVFSPQGDGDLLVSASSDRTAVVWRWRNPGADTLRLQGHRFELLSAEVAPDGKTILTTSLDSTAIRWDAVTGTGIDTLRHSAKLLNGFFSGDQVLTVTTRDTAWLWDGKGRPTPLPAKELTAWCESGRFYAAGSPDRRRPAAPGTEISRTGFFWPDDQRDGRHIGAIRRRRHGGRQGADLAERAEKGID